MIGAATLDNMTLCIMTLGIVAQSIRRCSVSFKTVMLSADRHYAECRSTETDIVISTQAGNMSRLYFLDVYGE